MSEAKTGDRRRANLTAFVGISALLHSLGLVLLVTATPVFPELPSEVAAETNWVDIDIAPTPPEGFEPDDEAALEKEAATAVTLVEDPIPTPAPNPSEDGIAVWDAGVSPRDAAVATATREHGDIRDAGPPPAQDTDEVVADKANDGGVLVASMDGGPGRGDAGTAVAASSRDGGTPSKDGGVGVAAAALDAGAVASGLPPPGAQTDFRPYVPTGDIISVLIRFDRVRGTPWVKEAEAILTPMPDYRMIVGGRTLDVTNFFDSLFFTTPRPNDVTATTVVARTSQAPASVRALLNHPQAPISWQAGQGGAIGAIGKSMLRHPKDKRLYVTPEPGLVVLADPVNLGALAKSAPGQNLSAVASESMLPPWLAKARLAHEEAGTDTGPWLVVTMQGIPSGFQIPDFVPGLGSLPVPNRMALALELVEGGFHLRGSVYFDNPLVARKFVKTLTTLKGKANHLGYRQLLNKLNLRNAIKGLTLTRKEKVVTLATSLSIADGRAAIREAAKRTKKYYSGN
jgi:hypothetical protein